jgi:hypothetical protein
MKLVKVNLTTEVAKDLKELRHTLNRIKPTGESTVTIDSILSPIIENGVKSQLNDLKKKLL